MKNSERITDVYGEHMLCDEVRHISVNGKSAELFCQLKMYDTERQKKYSKWNFCGCLIKIKGITHSENLFCCNEKTFHRMIPEEYSKIGKIKGFHVYSDSMDYDKESLAGLLDRMEKTVCNVLSYTYAISLMENEMSLVFWNLDLYPAEVVEEQLRELLKNL